MLTRRIRSYVELLCVIGGALAWNANGAPLPELGTSRQSNVPEIGTSVPSLTKTLTPLFDNIEERTFHYFWDTANPKNGLVPDRYPTPSYASIAAVGFALTAYPVGVERGYVTRKQARKRVLTTLRFLRNAPQGHAVKGVTGYKGFFYHFLDMKTGQRFEESELSTVDTAILLAG